MSYTYPPAPVGLTQGATALEIHQFMKTPALLARRLQTLLSQRYISDYLLQGRYVAVGGAILYPGTPEGLFTADDPEAISPGGEYPLTTLDEGTLQTTKTVKWGRDIEVFDEAIARYLIDPVNRALTRLANHQVRYVDQMTLGVIASKLTQTFAAGAAWTGDGGQIIEDVLSAKATVDEMNLGWDLNTIVLKPTQYAKVMARLLRTGLLPRESASPINTGNFPEYMGLTWTTSVNVPVTDPLLVDRSVLGGMADENIGGPGYVSAGGAGIEAKTMRLDNVDGYRVRCRRVTVPVVMEPTAGIRITGTGI